MITNKYLPSDSWKYQQSLYSSFNNELIKGHNSGLALYDYDTDLNLYKQTDYKPLDAVSFDKTNKLIDENDNLYNNAKSVISGAIQGTVEGGSNAFNIVLEKFGEGLNTFAKKVIGIDNLDFKPYILGGGVLILIFFVLNKK